MKIDPDAPVAILCGGRGTRLQQGTASIPKPLVEIGGLPILWHVIQIYASQGLRRFLLCTGYKGEMIARFVDSQSWPQGTEVTCIDTGPDTPTGGRLKRLEPLLGGFPFHATYADGVGDVDIAELVGAHERRGSVATMTVVRPLLQFGITELDQDGGVLGFREKPRSEDWINGGFFYCEPELMGYLQESSVLEREPLERLAADGALGAFRHEGFWDCMDTYKDSVMLNDLWVRGDAPWKVWS